MVCRIIIFDSWSYLRFNCLSSVSGPLYPSHLVSLCIIVVAFLPSILFGFFDKQPIVPYRKEPLSLLQQAFLLPVTICRIIIEFGENKRDNVIIHYLILFVGFGIASNIAYILYVIFILETVLPIAIYLVIWALAIAFLLWIVAKLFFGSKSEATITSRERTTILGNNYTAHYDDSGNEIAQTQQKDGLLGNKYSETRDSEGNLIAKSEEKQRMLGGKYIEHRTADGKTIGTSEEKDSLFGEKQIEHRDAEGKVIGKSRKGKGLLGDDYSETTRQ